MKVQVSILLISVLLLHGGIVSQLQSPNGLWETAGGIDYLGSALALGNLSEKDEASIKARSAIAKMPLTTHLFSAMLKAKANSDLDGLSEYRQNDGCFALEQHSHGDAVCTAWALTLFANRLSEEWLIQATAYLLANQDISALYGNDGFRRALFIESAIARSYASGRCPDVFPQGWKERIVSILHERFDAFKWEAQETALITLTAALLGEWELASIGRHNLLECENADGGWGETWNETDLVTTCFALEALAQFHLAIPDKHPDLAWAPYSEDDNGVILMNIGNAPAYTFSVDAYGVQADSSSVETQTWKIPCLLAGRSIKIPFSPLERLFPFAILADSRGEILDIARENNILWIPIQQIVNDACTVSEIYVNGAANELPVFLMPGRGIKLSATILCATESDYARDVNYSWIIDGERVSGGAYQLSEQRTGEISLEWHPQKGHYEIALEVYTAFGVFTRSISLDISYDNALLLSRRLIDGTMKLHDDFGAREYVDLFAYSAISKTTAAVYVFCGEEMLCETTKIDARHFQFFTRTYPPGEYLAVAVFSNKSGDILATAEHSFTILPQAVLEKPRILSPTYPLTLYTETPFAPTIHFEYGYSANMASDAELRWSITDANDVAEAKSEGIPFQLTPEEYGKSFQTEMTPHTFRTPGLYHLTMEISANEQTIYDSTLINVIQAPTLTLENLVAPEIIDAEENVASTVVRLYATPLSSQGIPCTFKASSDNHINNADDSRIEITLSDIRDANGLIVQEGRIIAAVKYGKMTGGMQMSSESRQEGDSILLEIHNGTTSFFYTAGHGKLLQGESATLPVEIFQSSPTGKPIMPRIGTIDVFIHGNGLEE